MGTPWVMSVQCSRITQGRVRTPLDWSNTSVLEFFTWSRRRRRSLRSSTSTAIGKPPSSDAPVLMCLWHLQVYGGAGVLVVSECMMVVVCLSFAANRMQSFGGGSEAPESRNTSWSAGRRSRRSFRTSRASVPHSSLKCERKALNDFPCCREALPLHNSAPVRLWFAGRQ